MTFVVYNLNVLLRVIDPSVAAEVVIMETGVTIAMLLDATATETVPVTVLASMLSVSIHACMEIPVPDGLSVISETIYQSADALNTT